MINIKMRFKTLDECLTMLRKLGIKSSYNKKVCVEIILEMEIYSKITDSIKIDPILYSGIYEGDYKAAAKISKESADLSINMDVIKYKTISFILTINKEK